MRADEIINVPQTGRGVNLTDFNFSGTQYKIVSDTISWTAVDTDEGVLYDVYAIRASSTTSGTCYLVATSTTTTFFNLVVVNDDVNTSATSYLDPDSLISKEGNRYPIRYTAGLKAKSSDVNLDFMILYRAK